MIFHYLTIAFRNLFRNKFYSIITVTGLSFGMASVFLIVQYLKSELSYDRFHEGAENIYRISWENTNSQTRTPYPMAQAMVQEFPEVENAVSLSPLWGPGLTRAVFSFSNPEKDIKFDERNVLTVDTTFFKVFSFKMIHGDARTVLKNPGGILISRSTALKYFGSTDVIGKQLEVNSTSNLLHVLGVFEDVPSESHIHFDILVSMLRMKAEENPASEYYTWKDFGHYNYIRLKPGANAKLLESKLLDWSRKYVDFSEDDMNWLKKNNYGFRLQPLTDIHLRSHLRWELEPNGNIAYVYLMAAAALLILVIGVVNFVNLSMAQASERAKEIGIRKSLGAFRRQLTFQFLGESIVITFISLLIALIFIELSIPLFHALTGKSLSFEFGTFIGVLLALGVMVATVTGIYPSLYLSSLKPALILKDKLLHTKGLGLRRAFIVFQFVTSMSLISATIIISQQLNFLQHKDLGFNAEELVTIPIKDHSMDSRIEELRIELLKIKGVTAVSAASNIPGKSFNQNAIYASLDPQHRVDVSEEMIDADFLKTLDINLVEGRSFLKDNKADRDGFILNETAVKQLHLKDPIGKEIVWERDGPVYKGPIIGVIKDFHFQSLHEPLRPLMMRLESNYNYAVVKVNTSEFEPTIRQIESVWHKFDNRFSFEFSFLDSQLTMLYQAEQNMTRVLNILSFIGVVIASMGLLGIAALTFRQRTKEVSIRKVLGASLPNLVLLLVKDFTRLIILAVIIAVPFVWWLMAHWLENFSYRITINPLLFLLTGIGLVLLSWGTLSFLTVNTAKVNPATTLKSE